MSAPPKVLMAVGIGVLALVLGVLGFAFLGGGGRSDTTVDSSLLGTKADLTSATVGTSVGERAPEFQLTSIDGTVVSSEIDRPKVIFFMAAWCTTCVPESRALARLHQTYGDRVQIISVDVDTRNDTVADTRRFQQNYGGPWPHVLDWQIAQLFKVRSLDTTYILNRNNVITYNDAWPTDYGTLEREVLKVLSTEGS